MTNTISLEILTPSREFYKGDVELVIATTTEGEEGYMANHAWVTKVLEPGGLWIREPGSRKFKTVAVSNGFVDVRDDITVFTDAAEWRENIDIEKAKASKLDAEAWLATDGEKSARDLAAAHSAIKRAEVRIKISKGGVRDR